MIYNHAVRLTVDKRIEKGSGCVGWGERCCDPVIPDDQRDKYRNNFELTIPESTVCLAF